MDDEEESKLKTHQEHKELYGIRQLKPEEIREYQLTVNATECIIDINGFSREYHFMKDVAKLKYFHSKLDSKVERFFKRSDLHYPRLNKYDQIDGYINTSRKICIFGPCALYNPAASQILIWICLWRGRCGKIIKCVVYDPVNKKIIDNWKGLIFYRLTWIFANEMASNLVAQIMYCSYVTVYVKHQVFDELEVREAYEKYCLPYAYRVSGKKSSSPLSLKSSTPCTPATLPIDSLGTLGLTSSGSIVHLDDANSAEENEDNSKRNLFNYHTFSCIKPFFYCKVTSSTESHSLFPGYPCPDPQATYQETNN